MIVEQNCRLREELNAMREENKSAIKHLQKQYETRDRKFKEQEEMLASTLIPVLKHLNFGYSVFEILGAKPKRYPWAEFAALAVRGQSTPLRRRSRRLRSWRVPWWQVSHG